MALQKRLLPRFRRWPQPLKSDASVPRPQRSCLETPRHDQTVKAAQIALSQPHVDANGCFKHASSRELCRCLRTGAWLQGDIRTYKPANNLSTRQHLCYQQNLVPIGQRQKDTMVSSTAKTLINYVGKVKPSQITSPAWKDSVQKFCEKFEAQVDPTERA